MDSKDFPKASDLLGENITSVFVGQLLLAHVVKQGGMVKISVEEVDATGEWIMEMQVDQIKQELILIARRKQ
jgi:hypothetical protein